MKCDELNAPLISSIISLFVSMQEVVVFIHTEFSKKDHLHQQIL